MKFSYLSKTLYKCDVEKNESTSVSKLVANAKKDLPTVSKDGKYLVGGIEGVFIHKPPVHADHRGKLVEMFTMPEFWSADFAYAYQTSIRPGM